MPEIKVHEKALAHLSRGLYRSPASALRELVSNAWDANATLVRIDTNHPNFFRVVIEDNGEGFTAEQFGSLMEGGIGISDKRSRKRPELEFGRPMVGRLGIGLLGIAQVCGSFTITSTPKTGKGFSAKVRFYDLLREALDNDDPTRVKPGNQSITEVDVGKYDFVENPLEAQGTGTTVITDDLHPTFVQAFQHSVDPQEFKKYQRPHIEWTKNLGILRRVRSLQEMGDYWRLLWELSASCPIPYLSDDALPKSLIQPDNHRLQTYNFRVVVDGIELRKPVFLKRHPKGYSAYAIPPTSKRVFGRDLQFHGYIVVQEGVQLKPDELRGILIRINEVGVGYYDPSLLDYRYNEGPRSRWLTGEVYVDKGLENALNVDRDSFNRFHPEYRAVQSTIHEILHDQLFPNVYRNIEKRSQKRSDARQATRANEFSSVLEGHFGRKITIVEEEAKPDGDPSQLVAVEAGIRAVRVTLPEIDVVPTKKTHRQLAAQILALYDVAMTERDSKARRRAFWKLVTELLKTW